MELSALCTLLSSLPADDIKSFIVQKLNDPLTSCIVQELFNDYAFNETSEKKEPRLQKQLAIKNADFINLAIPSSYEEDVQTESVISPRKEQVTQDKIQEQAKEVKKPPAVPPRVNIQKQEEKVATRSRLGYSESDASLLHSNVPVTDAKRKITIDDTSQTLSLDYVLNDPTLCNGFRKLLKKNYAEENLLFLKEVSQYEDNYHFYTDTEKYEKAKFLLDTYIVEGAPKQINVIHGVVKDIKTQLETSGADKNLFFNAKDEIRMILLTDCYPKFVNDKTYEESKNLLRQIRNLAVPISSPGETMGLTTREWQFIFLCATPLTLEPANNVLEQSKLATDIFILDKGCLNVTKTQPKVPDKTAEIYKIGSFFGELSLVGCLRSAFTIQSASSVELLSIKSSHLFLLLQNNLDLAYRFFKQMAKKFATILYFTYIPEPVPSEVLTSSQNAPIDVTQSPSINRREREYCSTNRNAAPPANKKGLEGWFSGHWYGNYAPTDLESDSLIMCLRQNFPSLPPTEIPVKIIRCFMESGGVISSGLRRITLLVTQNFICIYSEQPKNYQISFELNLVSMSKKSKNVLVFKAPKKLAIKCNSEVERDQLYQLIEGLVYIFHSDKTEVNVDLSLLRDISHSFSMTNDDWTELYHHDMNNNPCTINYVPGDTIIQAGQKYAMLGKIVSGSCRVTYVDNKNPVWLGKGEILGEISFLTEEHSNCTIVACEPTTIQILDIIYIKSELRMTNIATAAKLYRYLCSVIAQQLTR